MFESRSYIAAELVPGDIFVHPGAREMLLILSCVKHNEFLNITYIGVNGDGHVITTWWPYCVDSVFIHGIRFAYEDVKGVGAISSSIVV